MSKISQYVIDTLPTVSDYIVGTDAETLQTRNYKIGKIVDLQAIKPTGSFYHIANQNGNALTPQVVLFATSDIDATYQWSVVSNSRLTPQVAGLYNFDFTFFLSVLLGTVPVTAYFWLRKNGTTIIPNSSVARVINTTTDVYPVNANYSIDLEVGDYIEVMWQISAVGPTVQLLYQASVLASGPAMPSAAVTINKI